MQQGQGTTGMDALQIQHAVSKASCGWLYFPDWASWLLVFIVFAIGVFFRSYFSSRARTFATKQDLEEITHQLKHTSEVTEEIKANIGKGVWLHQQRWEFKKQLYTELLESLFELQSTLFDLIRLGDKKLNEKEERHRGELEIRRAETKEIIRRVAGKASIILPEDTIEIFRNMYGELMRTPDKGSAFDFDDADAELAQVESAYEYFVQAAKKDLNIA